MAGSAHSGGPRDEQGKLIRFPRGGSWIPADGIEPLTGDPATSPSTNSATATHDSSPADGSAFEADDFWGSGDTQQFVGVASSRSGSAPNDIAAKSVPASATMSTVATTTTEVFDDQSRTGFSERSARARLHRGFVFPTLPVRGPTALAAAGLVAVVLVGTGAAVELNAGTSPRPVRHTAARVAHTTRTAVHRSAPKPAREKRRPMQSASHTRPHRPHVTHPSTSPAPTNTAAASAQPTSYESRAVQPSYQATTPASGGSTSAPSAPTAHPASNTHKTQPTFGYGGSLGPGRGASGTQ